MQSTAASARRFPFAPGLATAFAAVIAALLLSACGFHLRGLGGTANLPFRSVYLQASATSPFAIELRRYLVAGGTAVVNDPKQAEAVLEINSEAREKQILSLNSQGRTREYTLLSKVGFQLRDAAGGAMLPQTEVVVRRVQSFNESLVLAKETEEATLYRDMQSDLVQQLLRRVAAAKPLAQPQTVPAPALQPQPK